VAGIRASVDRWLPDRMVGACLVAASGMPAACSAALVRSGVLAGWPSVGQDISRPYPRSPSNVNHSLDLRLS